MIIWSPNDERVNLTSTYVFFDNYNKYLRADKHVYFPIKDFKILDGFMYRNSTYPFISNNLKWRYIILYEDIKEYIWSEGEKK